MKMDVRSPRIGPAVLLRLLFVLVLVFGAFAPIASAGQGEIGGSTPIKSANGVYIVRLADAPVLSYRGGVAGLAATARPEGVRPDRRAPDVQAYAAYLAQRQDEALQAVGAADKLYSYRYTLNGFAARLTPEQAAALKQIPGVVAVEPDELVFADTVTTPSFLGLDQPGGLWAQLGGPGRAGEGVIVGVVDSGIWPESASFADDGTYRPLATWKGTCVTGEEWDASLCNNKLIGARYYNAGYGGDAGIDAQRPWEYNSPRDFGGHGTHTSSTAAGNYHVAANAEGTDLGLISGMAPHARVAMYKALWDNGAGSSSGYTSDLVAAIEDATMDGVDVINYSISGSTTSVSDSIAIAFLNAAGAGVFVAASAGNSGPTSSTVAHNYPWITTVAAGSHDRDYLSSVTLGNGATYAGKSLGSGTAMLPLIPSTAAGLAGQNATEVRLCFSGTLDPAVVAGKIVLCDRGSNARVDKSLAVKMAGGAGMILANTSPSSLNADLHFVPTVHVDEVAGAAIKAYISAAGAAATAQLAPGVKTQVEAPFVASFSSRGPARAASGDLLKPDIMAPGVDVLAAVAPPGNAGRNFDFYSGTSMSAPHIAGLAALLKQRQPAWTPDMIKSALMTTASQITNAGNPLTGNPFDYGAGQVNPNAAINPGLVYRVKLQDYGAFLCGQGLLDSNGCAVRSIGASDLNLPSIAIGSLAGSQTVARTVTNVTNSRMTYTASISGLAGFDVQVSPATITVAPGASASFTVKFTRTTATLNSYAFGSLTWKSNGTSVRSPIALRPVALAAPAEVTGAGTNSSMSYNITFGYSGAFSAQPHGLVPATTFVGTVADDPTDNFVPGGPGTTSFVVAIPADTRLARFSLFDNYTDGADDLDLYVFNSAGTLVGSSGSGTSAEQVNLSNPAAGNYTVWVHGYATDGPDANFTLFTWAVTSQSAGNLVVTAPATATTGATGAITLNWTGLLGGTKYLGTVTYHTVAAPTNYNDGRIGTTIVSVNTD